MSLCMDIYNKDVDSRRAEAENGGTCHYDPWTRTKTSVALFDYNDGVQQALRYPVDTLQRLAMGKRLDDRGANWWSRHSTSTTTIKWARIKAGNHDRGSILGSAHEGAEGEVRVQNVNRQVDCFATGGNGGPVYCRAIENASAKENGPVPRHVYKEIAGCSQPAQRRNWASPTVADAGPSSRLADHRLAKNKPTLPPC
ncbi:hypothetical protein BDZ89DRAFT_1035130 [Hymenopellis radicata]|nr:hypothetical protein BDZ89DRAFT_1035130 [Hymenopellis radicata]